MSEETKKPEVKYFCKKTFKEIPFGVMLKKCQQMGFAAAMECFVELPLTHPKCKLKPQDKEWDKENLDQYGMPTLIDKRPKEISPEHRAFLELTGAKRYIASTDWYVSRKNETGEAIPADVETKRAECYAKIQAAEASE